MDGKDLIIYDKTIPARKGSFIPYPEELSEDIKNYLRINGIEALYSHQGEMFEQARSGKDVVITTATASGKTLSFLLPVLQEILNNPLARAIFIYPTKALASDQYRAILPYLEHFGQERIVAGVYDGDTPVHERSRIRKSANIILTNPEMLNSAFLPNHSKFGFDFIFSNLRYIVIDELHTYRGAFGSHLANVFRRLQRVCNYYHSSPQFLCSSATIANPLELAENICSRTFVLVDQDGSPAAKRRYVLLQPPKVMGEDQTYYGQVQPSTVAAELLPELVEKNQSFIAFAKSRKSVEIVLKEARDRMRTESFFGSSMMEQISGYRGGYTPIERKEIETKMITGAIKGLVSTNALELGIDIGKINTTVLIGYPGTRASFWQQTGRAGRSGTGCNNYLILDNLPFDQYIALNPEWLFENSSENAVIDKNNLLIELAHIRAAAAELPLTLDDIHFFPDLGETIPVLLKVDELSNQNGRFAWAGGEFPAGDFSLRNIDKNRYKLIDQENNKEVTEMDESQAFHELHKGAIYLHDGISYQVLSLNLDSKTAYGIPFDGNYYTMPGGETNIQVIHKSKEQEVKRVKVAFGDVNVQDYVYMYKKLQFHNHQNLGYEQLPQPLTKEFDTESTWIHLPENVVRTYRGLLQETQNGQVVRNNHFEGVCYAIQNAAMMVTMTEQADIGVTTSLNALELSGPSADDVSVYVYDRFVGGLGFSEKIFDCMEDIVDSAIQMVSGCPCKDGCAACIGDYKLDKNMVLWGLKNLKEELEVPVGVKAVPYAPVSFIKKKFLFKELPEQWAAFCAYIKMNGESYGDFLSNVSKVEVGGNRLTLVLHHAFYGEWVMEPTNKKSIINIIQFHVETPPVIQLHVRVEEQEEQGELGKEIQRKIARRYEHLNES
nr:DEAD/DEAH box helicase [Anaerosporobacter faecicola]